MSSYFQPQERLPKLCVCENLNFESNCFRGRRQENERETSRALVSKFQGESSG